MSAPTVSDIQAEITANAADLVETDQACIDLENTWEEAEKQDQRDLAIDPDAPADAQAKVDVQLKRKRTRCRGLEERAEGLKVRLNFAKATEFRAKMPALIQERRRINKLAQTAMDLLCERMAAHIELGQQLRELHQRAAAAASGGVSGPTDRGKFDSENILSTWIVGSVSRIPGLRIDTSRGVPSDFAPLPDMDSAVQ